MPVDDVVGDVDPEVDNDGDGGEDAPQTIPLDALPESLRGKSPEEIRTTIERATRLLSERNDENEGLKSRLAALEARSNERPAEKAEEDPDDKMTDEELIYKNPRKVIARTLRDMGVVREFDRVSKNADDSALMMVGHDYDDFDEHKEDVKNALKAAGAEFSEANIRGAYKMVIGDKLITQRQEESRKSKSRNGAEPPSPRRGDPPKDPELSDLDIEIGRGTGFDMNSKEGRKSYNDWAKKEYVEMEVPTGRPKKKAGR